MLFAKTKFLVSKRVYLKTLRAYSRFTLYMKCERHAFIHKSSYLRIFLNLQKVQRALGQYSHALLFLQLNTGIIFGGRGYFVSTTVVSMLDLTQNLTQNL